MTRFLVRRLSLLLSALMLCAPLVAAAQKAPVIVRHVAPETAEREKELSLRANIVAAAGAYLPTLYYRMEGETRYYSLPMLPVPGSINIYAASVPGLFVTKQIEYYLESYDTQLRGPGRAGDQKKPLVVKVVDPEIPPSQVVIRSDPPDAEVVLDGKSVGVTPYLGVLPAGPHELLLKKEGFLETVTTLEVPENRDLEILRSLPEAAERAQFAVTSDPPGAIVSIGGQVLGETPLIAPTPEGEHTLTVEKQGYARAERTLLFSKERSIETSFSLVKLPPEPALAVTTDPPGASVIVDDKELGKTPFLGVVPTGEHTLLLKMEGKRTAQAQILMPEDRDLDLRFTLVEATVQREPLIAISSDPSGATITIDGAELTEKTPYIGKLPPGPHTIKLVADKFQPYERKITMPETNDIEITLALVPVPPPPGPSKVTIDSDPGDVEIVVDGKPAGNSPVTLELEAGAHVAIAKKEGFRSIEERFTVTQGESMKFKLALSKVEKDVEDPLLSVRSDPDGATVTIDGKMMEQKTPFSMALKPGKHKLSVSKEGFKTQEETFELPADRTFELRYAFNLEALRKSVQLASATEAKKEKPAEPIVDTSEVQSGGKANAKVRAATTTSAQPSALGATRIVNTTTIRNLPPQLVYAPESTRVGPIALALTGAALTGAGAYFGVTAMKTALELTDPEALVDRADIYNRHTRQVQATLGLAGLGVGLATIAAIWAALPDDPPQGAIPIDEARKRAAMATSPAEEKKAQEPAKKPASGDELQEGSGGDADVSFGFAPTSGGGVLSVGARF